MFATATITLTREDDGSPCSSSIVLTCSYQNTQFVRIEECAANTMHFTLVTRTTILSNPDFEEVISAELYMLRISRVERYNGTRYRCQGFNAETEEEVVSNEWTLIVPSEFVTAVQNSCCKLVLQL